MTNQIITLTDPATLVADFSALIMPGDKALFVILGNTPQHQTLANAAQLYATKWRFVVLITAPITNLQTYFSAIKNNVTPPIPAEPWFAISIAFAGSIEGIYINNDPINIIPAFILAET